MTTDGQPLPTTRPARGGDLTPDPAPYPFASRRLASSAGAMHYSDEGSDHAIAGPCPKLGDRLSRLARRSNGASGGRPRESRAALRDGVRW